MNAEHHRANSTIEKYSPNVVPQLTKTTSGMIGLLIPERQLQKQVLPNLDSQDRANQKRDEIIAKNY